MDTFSHSFKMYTGKDTVANTPNNTKGVTNMMEDRDFLNKGYWCTVVMRIFYLRLGNDLCQGRSQYLALDQEDIL